MYSEKPGNLNKDYSVPGVSQKDSIGHASQVYHCNPLAAMQDVSKVKTMKKSMNGYDAKAYDYKY